jgi:hypothetical protein
MENVKMPRVEGKTCNIPLGVAILLDIVLAFSESVPELDGPVARTRHDLPVVCTKADGKDVRRVANKSAGGGARVEVPKAKCVVPGGREGELAVRGDDDVRYKMIMATEDTFWIPV